MVPFIGVLKAFVKEALCIFYSIFTEYRIISYDTHYTLSLGI
jgi:hypothetical protein